MIFDRTSSTQRKFSGRFASARTLGEASKTGTFFVPGTAGSKLRRQCAVLALLCGVMGAATGCASHDNHEETRDSRQDAQKAAQNIANDPHIPPQVKQMLQERGKAMQAQRPAPK